MSRTPLLAVAALLALGACSSTTTAATASTVAAASSAPAASSASSAPAASAASVPAASGSIRSYGAASKECKAAQTALTGAGNISLGILDDSLSQATIDAAYAAPELKDLPSEAQPAWADFKSAVLPFVGVKLATLAPGQMKGYGDATNKLTETMATICR